MVVAYCDTMPRQSRLFFFGNLDEYDGQNYAKNMTDDQSIPCTIIAATDDEVYEIFETADKVHRSIIMRCLEEHERHTLVDCLAIKYPSQRLHESTVHRLCSTYLSRDNLTAAMGACSRGASKDAARDIIRWVNDHDDHASFMRHLSRNTYPFIWDVYIVEAVIDTMLGRQDDAPSVARVAAAHRDGIIVRQDGIIVLSQTVIDAANKWASVYPSFMSSDVNAIITHCDMEILDIFVAMSGAASENLLNKIINYCVWLASSSAHADITPAKSMKTLRHILEKYPEAIHIKQFTVCSNCYHREIIEFMYEHSSHEDINPIDMCTDSLRSSTCVRFLVDVGYLMKSSTCARRYTYPIPVDECTACSVAILIRSGLHDLFEWKAVPAEVARKMIDDGYLPYMSVFDGIMCERGNGCTYQVDEIAAAYTRRNRLPTIREGALMDVTIITE